MGSRIAAALALALVILTALAPAAQGRPLYLSRGKAFNANAADNRSFCRFVNSSNDPILGTCLRVHPRLLGRLSRTSFLGYQREDYFDGSEYFSCWNRTRITLRRFAGVSVSTVPGSVDCS